MKKKEQITKMKLRRITDKFMGRCKVNQWKFSLSIRLKAIQTRTAVQWEKKWACVHPVRPAPFCAERAKNLPEPRNTAVISSCRWNVTMTIIPYFSNKHASLWEGNPPCSWLSAVNAGTALCTSWLPLPLLMRHKNNTDTAGRSVSESPWFESHLYFTPPFIIHNNIPGRKVAGLPYSCDI